MKLIKEIRSREGELHFKRWRLLKTPWFEVYIHGIYMHDLDEHLHSHPWKIWTMILWGGYFEELHNPKGANKHRLRTFGHMSRSNTSGFHKIAKMYKVPTYSLAIVGKRTNPDWGYMVNGKFVDHLTYRENKNKERN